LLGVEGGLILTGLRGVGIVPPWSIVVLRLQAARGVCCVGSSRVCCGCGIRRGATPG
jgi:hypothetical protein